MRFYVPGFTASLILAMCAPSCVQAADPQAYNVDIASTNDAAMDAALHATSELSSLRTAAPVSPFGLIARALGETERLKIVLESFGFYQSTVSIKIDGMSLNSAGLADALNALPKGSDAQLAVSFQLGPLYHLREVTIDGSIPQAAAGAFSLKSGAVAVAADVLAAGSRLLFALQEQGYAFAKVDPPVAYEDKTDPVLDVSFHVDAGVRVKFGEIRFEGLKRMHDKLLRRRLAIRSGQQYSASAIERARRDLLGLAPFAAVSVQLGASVDASGGVPITFVLRERPRHAVTVNSAYSTDLGGSAGVTWSDRNVFGNAERLDLAASVINLGGSATTGIGYNTSAKLLFPDFERRDQSLQFAVGAIQQSLQAYDQKAITAGVILSRKLSSVWTASAGVTASNERIHQEAVLYTYTLLALPLSVTYDSTDLASPLDDPVHGMRNALSLTPTLSAGHPNARFIISQLKLATYFDVHELGFANPGRTVLAARFLTGIAQGAGEFSLPPDQRFYGGGSGTVRGYAYQSVGPKFETDGNPIGGTKIAAGTLELRQRFGKSVGAAVFVDAGQVTGCSNEFRVGVGAGARYYTPIGPVRVDVALPTKRYATQYPLAASILATTAGRECNHGTSAAPPAGYPNTMVRDAALQIYIGLGQAF